MAKINAKYIKTIILIIITNNQKYIIEIDELTLGFLFITLMSS